MSKEIINVTDITSYLFCQRKLFLKRVKKIKEPPTKPMINGMLKHKVFDIFNKNENILVSEIKQQINSEEIGQLYNNLITEITKDVFSNYYNMAKSFGIEYPEMLRAILKLMNNDIKVRAEAIELGLSQGFLGKDLWRNLTPKYRTELEIVSPELGLKGRIDRVKIGEEIIPFEIKTREEIYEADKIQLAAYSLLLEQEFNKPVTKGIVETASQQQEIKITEEMKNKVLEIAEKIRNMQTAEFPNNFNKCENCRIKKECFEI